MTVLVDTSALLALVRPHDPNHEAARVWTREHIGQAELAITTYAEAETLALCSRRLGMDTARRVSDVILTFERMFVTPFEHRAALAQFIGSGRGLSLVDCATFAVMRARGIRTAFAFDQDFERAGFEVVPARA